MAAPERYKETLGVGSIGVIGDTDDRGDVRFIYRLQHCTGVFQDIRGFSPPAAAADAATLFGDPKNQRRLATVWNHDRRNHRGLRILLRDL